MADKWLWHINKRLKVNIDTGHMFTLEQVCNSEYRKGPYCVCFVTLTNKHTVVKDGLLTESEARKYIDEVTTI
jgi:hypothetical protein